ncbi:hypothetical protein HJ059_22585 [Vibrio parahaemolyticus]|uniref:hypothetical protein n=2 Tax=Vibrio parahaemolyticus TaxID=670 RepID=UPI0004192DB4|nr:hypothetical protein [Vibrio parahaemolyticus]EGQ9275242.1 hypothetical protein [Vibrio parahaemolyticus]EGQ9712245.1 hypothetical protein [Vibrio parahaemolyticus]EGQ9799046.1 hypothetical protein [Vibrio parahaemolyticus]EIA0904499.1 hypothetical protein [Vibrio parahaemolyticus]EID0733741.1 hypothetical protein [Vibrio parahaemolyticus]
MGLVDMFIKTKEILEASESALLGFSINRSLLKPVQRFFVYPLVYLKIGFGDFTKPMAVWSFCSFAALVVLALFSSKIEMPREIFLILTNICIWGVLLLTTFLTPSTYAFYGATEVSVNKIVDILDENGVKSESDIELLESNLEKVEKRIEARVKFYKWIIGAFWGLYLLAFNFQLRFLSLSDKPIDGTFLKSSFEGFLYVILFTVFALLAMISYKRASNMLIANLQFACVEQKSRQPAA